MLIRRQICCGLIHLALEAADDDDDVQAGGREVFVLSPDFRSNDAGERAVSATPVR